MTDEDLKLANAIRYTCSVVKKWTKDGSVRIPELSAEFKRARAVFQPVMFRVGQGEAEFKGYQISDDMAAVELTGAYDRDPDAAMLIRENLRTNVFHGTPMPPIARLLAWRIMGGATGCVPKGRPTEMHRNTLLRGLVFRIRENWGFDLAYNPKNTTYSP